MVVMVLINQSVWKFNFLFGNLKVKLYGMFIYFIYARFKFVLWFGPYHKNIVDKAQIATGFAFNERIDASLFELKHIFAYIGAHIVPKRSLYIWIKDLT